jgi:hypothetical protein
MNDKELSSKVLSDLANELKNKFLDELDECIDGFDNTDCWKITFASLTSIIIDIINNSHMPVEEKSIDLFISVIRESILKAIKENNLNDKDKNH